MLLVFSAPQLVGWRSEPLPGAMLFVIGAWAKTLTTVITQNDVIAWMWSESRNREFERKFDLQRTELNTWMSAHQVIEECFVRAQSSLA